MLAQTPMPIDNIPVADAKWPILRAFGALAQLGERRLCKAEVTGSTPVRSIFVNHAESVTYGHPPTVGGAANRKNARF
jgi:hypothetical protein